MNYAEESLKKHYEWKGKIEVTPRARVTNREELSVAYTPGVAEPCMVIHNDYEKSFELIPNYSINDTEKCIEGFYGNNTYKYQFVGGEFVE